MFVFSLCSNLSLSGFWSGLARPLSRLRFFFNSVEIPRLYFIACTATFLCLYRPVTSSIIGRTNRSRSTTLPSLPPLRSTTVCVLSLPYLSSLPTDPQSRSMRLNSALMPEVVQISNWIRYPSIIKLRILHFVSIIEICFANRRRGTKEGVVTYAYV